MTILKFFSKTCGPCKQMSKILADFRGAYIQDIDVGEDENDELVRTYKIKSVPTLIIVDDNNKVVKEFRGIVSLSEIEAAINGR